MLRQLGWIQVRGNRDSPRNSEVSLRDKSELLALRRELLALRKNPPAFIARVFDNHDRIWVDRCASIIE
jgi:hypothetical protein